MNSIVERLNENRPTEIVYDLPFNDYRKIDAINFSSLKNIITSPYHYKWSKQNRNDSTAMALGRAVHTKVLEPDNFCDEFVFYKERRAGQKWELFKRLNAGKEIINGKDIEQVKNMAASVHANPLAKELLKEGSPEVTITWTDSDTGLWCKARLDWVGPDYLMDFKTTKNATPKSFARSMLDYRYYMQFAFYRDGWEQCGGELDLPFRCVAVESASPYDCYVYNLHSDTLQAGKADCKTAMAKLKYCMDNSEWARAGHNEIHYLYLPNWYEPIDCADNDPFVGL